MAALQRLYDRHHEPFDLYIISISQMAKGGFSFLPNLLYVLMYNSYCIVFLFCFSSSYVPYVCQFLWNVYFWLPHRYSVRFIYSFLYYWQDFYRILQYKQHIGLHKRNRKYPPFPSTWVNPSLFFLRKRGYGSVVLIYFLAFGVVFFVLIVLVLCLWIVHSSFELTFFFCTESIKQ